EDHDDQQHEKAGLEESPIHFMDGLRNEQGCIERDVVDDALRKTGLQFLHSGTDAVGHVDRIGSRELVDGDACGGISIELKKLIVALPAEFYFRDVLQTRGLSRFDRTVSSCRAWRALAGGINRLRRRRYGLDDDFLELMNVAQASHRLHGVL